MRFDTKIAIAVREDLAAWQKLNVTAFLASAIAGEFPNILGQPYLDGSGNHYLPMFRQPVLVYAADAAGLSRVRSQGLKRGLGLAVYTEDMFATGNDADNRAVVAAVAAEKLNLVGLACHGARSQVDKALAGLSLHR